MLEDLFEELKELLFPVHCFGCKALGLEICSKCRRHWSPHLYIQKIEDLTVYSSIKYSPIARSILLNAKENSVELADELIIQALLNCLKRLPTNVLRHAILMPIPGSKRAIRKRGRDFILDISNELSLRSGIPIKTGMKVKRTLLDQSGLSSIDRKRNIYGAFEYQHLGEQIENSKVVLIVDDLVTTGSTLLEDRKSTRLNSSHT